MRRNTILSTKMYSFRFSLEMSGLRIANKPARPKYGTGLVKEPGVPIYPGFEPRIISEDERTVTTRCNL